ncbi:MAG: zinc-dependent peptidase [Chitinophagaceae bacterium]|nr:zinc-dependent peptidase [Chitinophagaceae bacterium]
MPQDTVYIIPKWLRTPLEKEHLYIHPSGDSIYLPDSFFGTGGYEGWVIAEQIRKQNEIQYKKEQSDFSWVIFLVLLITGVVLAVLTNLVEAIPEWIERRKRIKKAKVLIDERGIQYHNWLISYNPYYASLTEAGKERFLIRTAAFMQSKVFRYHAMIPEEYIPVLISGAAVQITFGLRNFLMDYFSVIHVIKGEYRIPGNDEDIYHGHVSRKGIHVAWNHFLYGFGDYKDCINVGLHEMAHAVSYDAFLGAEDLHDARFKRRLEEFRKLGRPVFRAMRAGDSHLLDNYAATNIDEFWAVCVETFFENTEEFKRTMPDLYHSITCLLNQDPLDLEKIINKKLAWLAI